MKKDVKVYFVLIVIIIVIVCLIFYIKGNGKIDEETIKCIANKSIMYSSRTCSACAAQKQILGNYTSYFNIIDCISEKQKCTDAGINGYPTWFINEKKYEGVQSLKELKKEAGC
jgi:glutaredoxin